MFLDFEDWRIVRRIYWCPWSRCDCQIPPIHYMNLSFKFGRTRFIWVGSIETLDEILRVFDILKGFPSIFFAVIAYPFDQEMYQFLLSNQFGIENGFNFKFFMTFNQIQRWFWMVGIFRVVVIGAKLVNVENWVNLPGRRKFEVIIQV